MIKRLEITFVHAEPDDNVRKYVMKKLGKLDRFLPKSAEASAHFEIFLKQGKSGRSTTGRDHCCEVNLHLPQGTINVSEKSINIYTAIDIVELKLKQQIRKYKELHAQSRLRRLAARLSRSTIEA